MKQEIPLQNGHIYVTPHIPQEDKILFHELPKKEQYWRRSSDMVDYKKLPRTDQIKYQDKFWEHYFEGCWFMNNGEPTYMPPRAWFFFDIWTGNFKPSGNHPLFRKEQLKQHYFKQLAVDSPDCLGTIKFKQRRDGATHIEISDMVYEGIQLVSDERFGMISKTGKDAYNICFLKVKDGLRGLPSFSKPLMAGSTDPKEEIIFGKPSSRITASNYKKLREQDRIDEDDPNKERFLNNTYNYGTTSENYYDGDKLYRLLIDEYCKFPTGISVRGCLETHIECVRLKSKKVGMINMISSPMEYQTKNLFESIDVYKESNYQDLQEDGRTVSNLWQWFSSAKFNHEDFIDIYGECDTEKSEEDIYKQRKKCKDATSLRALTMRMPLYIEEIIEVSNLECAFTHPKEMAKRRDYLRGFPYKDKEKTEPIYIHGNMIWKNGLRDTEVEFIPSNNQHEFSSTGRIKLAKHPHASEVNRFVNRVDVKYPHGDTNFVIGVDPIDIRRPKDGRKASKPAAWVGKCFDNTFCGGKDEVYAQYLWRPEKNPEEFFEDMIKLAVYFGAYVQFEAKNMRIANHFEDRGYWDFLLNENLKKQNERKGDTATTKLTMEMTLLIDQYFSLPITMEDRNNFDYFWFEDCFDDFLTFDPEDTEKSDQTMAFGQMLLGFQKRRLLRGNYKQDPGFIKEMIEYLVETG